jgi:hypothetical protein
MSAESLHDDGLQTLEHLSQELGIASPTGASEYVLGAY